MGQRKFQDIELASQKDTACYISWSRTHPVLVVGTEKGSLVFFNRKSQRKVPCISKHGKKVTHGDWSSEGFLMSASIDKMLTISNHQGDTPYETFIVKGEPSNVRWSPVQSDEEKVVCCIVNNTKLFRFVPNKLNHQFIEFDKSYKKVTSFEWDTDKSIIVAFESGFISVISMDPGALGKELHSFRPSMSPIEQIQINKDVHKVAIAS
jgi:WD repeat-containing protein 19